MLCFSSLLDENDDHISQEKAKVFFRRIYGRRLCDEGLNSLVKLLDFTDTNSITLDEFNHIYLICHSYLEYSLERPNSF